MLELPLCARFFLFFQDNEKRTPLHAAAYLGDAEIIELLILSGRDLEHCLHLWTVTLTSHLSDTQFINLHKMMLNNQGQTGFADVHCFSSDCLPHTGVPARYSPCLHVVPLL